MGKQLNRARPAYLSTSSIAEMSDVAQSPWTWDPSRHQYYYVHNGHWVFQDGLKICISSRYLFRQLCDMVG